MGTHQGGPLSPLLSNIVLDELDKELESRGHKFVRYADDFMMYCKSLKAAERVKRSIADLLRLKLKRKVNQDKSAVSMPWLSKSYERWEDKYCVPGITPLKKLGIAHEDAMLCGNARKKYWRMSKIKWVAIAMPQSYFTERGLYLPGC